MNDKIKALGPALVAVAAIAAIAASGAQAKSGLDVGVAGAGNATITGQIEIGQEFIWSIQNTAKTSTIQSKCAVANLEATTAQGVVSEFTATATYSGCKLAGLAATVRLNGCKYTFTTTETQLTGLVDITGCTTGKKFTIAATGCTLEFGEQNGLSHVIFKNEANNHVTLEWTVAGLTVTQKGLACPDGNGHTGTNAAVSVNTTLTAFTDTGTELVKEHEHEFNKSKHNGVDLALSAT